jgi:hypothetical protein
MDLTVKEYAKKHHLSIYQVVRKLQRGELEGYSREIDGKRVQFIKESISSVDSIKEPKIKKSSNFSISKEDIELLKIEIKALREEIKSLKSEVKSLRSLIEG